MPDFIGTLLYILDHNLRAAAILGLVGAGGIGMELQTALRLFNYNQAAVLILLLMVTIFSIDTLSGFLREKLR
jgi:phosphonate transport system permease protein